MKGYRPLDDMDRDKIARIVCGGNDATCHMPCDECSPSVLQAVNQVLSAITKIGGVVMVKEPKP